MNTPRKATGDRYRCPECKRWRGEHIKTGLLARHQAPGDDPYVLCHGSLHPLKGLPSQHTPAAYTSPYTQPTLFG